MIRLPEEQIFQLYAKRQKEQAEGWVKFFSVVDKVSPGLILQMKVKGKIVRGRLAREGKKWTLVDRLGQRYWITSQKVKFKEEENVSFR